MSLHPTHARAHVLQHAQQATTTHELRLYGARRTSSAAWRDDPARPWDERPPALRQLGEPPPSRHERGGAHRAATRRKDARRVRAHGPHRPRMAPHFLAQEDPKKTGHIWPKSPGSCRPGNGQKRPKTAEVSSRMPRSSEVLRISASQASTKIARGCQHHHMLANTHTTNMQQFG